MKSFKQMLGETVEKIKSPDEQNFADKHIVDTKDHPVAGDDQFVAKSKKAKRLADRKEGEDEAVYEEEDRMIECPDCGESYKKGEDHECDLEEMSKAQMTKREEIVKSMKKKMGDFKAKYGDNAEKVMYATATKMAMKEESETLVMEAVIDNLRKIVKSKKHADVKFADGNKVRVDLKSASAIVQAHDALSGGNQEKFEDELNKGETSFMKMLDFAFRVSKR